MNPPRRGKRSCRDSTRLCRVALLRGLPPLALLCGTAQCSASLSPPPAALSFPPSRLCRVALLRVFRRLHCSAALPNAPLRFLRHRRRSAFRRPGCAVPHCCADFRRLHCSAALLNAPLRFLRHRRRSVPHTRDPHSVPMEFEPLNTSLVHFQSRALRKNCPRQFSRRF